MARWERFEQDPTTDDGADSGAEKDEPPMEPESLINLLPVVGERPRLVAVAGDRGSQLRMIGGFVMGSEVPAASQIIATAETLDPAAGLSYLEAEYRRLEDELDAPIHLDARPCAVVGLSLAVALAHTPGCEERAAEILRELARISAEAFGIYSPPRTPPPSK